MMSLIPVVAISPILLYIGMLIGSQAFQETPKSHAPAIILGLVPHVAAWGKLQIDNALGAAGTNAAAVGFDKLGQVGILYQGLGVLGGGAILGGLMLCAIAVFVIEREFIKAAAFALAGAVLTFFGFMHGEQIGVGQTPLVAISYLGVAGILFGAPSTQRGAEAGRQRCTSMHEAACTRRRRTRWRAESDPREPRNRHDAQDRWPPSPTSWNSIPRPRRCSSSTCSAIS